MTAHPDENNPRRLRALLLDARSRTLALVRDLDGERLLGPRLAIVNPPLWEVGHVGWFQELWCLRHRQDGSRAASMLDGADAWYDSSAVPHGARWSLPLPSLEATLDYLARVLEAVLRKLDAGACTAATAYFVQLAAFHECMHAEAFSYTRQTLGYAAPADGGAAPEGGAWPGDVEIAGGVFRLGAENDGRFVFDNEKWAHEVRVEPFRMARAPVTNAEFQAFVDDGGYHSASLWSAEGARWREAADARTPVYWQRLDGVWCERQYQRLVPLAPHLPVLHVNAHEAQAYCRWAGRRLPTEAEWEFAAATVPGAPGVKRGYPWGDEPPHAGIAALHGSGAGRAPVGAYAGGDSAWGCRQMIGNVWEWTASPFEPYPGFSPDPYRDYSMPWFGTHWVLRGGCHATSPALIDAVYRNFYTPDRRDVYAGFRTCAAG